MRPRLDGSEFTDSVALGVGLATHSMELAAAGPHPVSPQRQVRDTAVRTTQALHATRDWVGTIGVGPASRKVSEEASDMFPTLPKRAAAALGKRNSVASVATTEVGGGLVDFRPSMFRLEPEDVYGEKATARFVSEYKRRVRTGTLTASFSFCRAVSVVVALSSCSMAVIAIIFIICY